MCSVFDKPLQCSVCHVWAHVCVYFVCRAYGQVSNLQGQDACDSRVSYLTTVYDDDDDGKPSVFLLLSFVMSTCHQSCNILLVSVVYLMWFSTFVLSGMFGLWAPVQCVL